MLRSLLVSLPHYCCRAFMSMIICLFHFPERDVAERSILIKNMMEDIGDQAMNEAIPIPNVRYLCPASS